jgi:pyroglutamyl-peptidase
MRDMKILLTGFNRFGTLRDNPSQRVVEAIIRRKMAGLTAEVLPTEFIAAGKRIRDLIRQLQPDWIICLGVAQGIPAIHLERVALNLDDTELPDNAGHVHAAKRIVKDGPLAYESTLPIEEMRDRLQQRGIPAAISNHAGTFVCNHVFYVARHEVERLALGARCGFIHLPAILNPGTDMPGMTLERMIEAVEQCL